MEFKCTCQNSGTNSYTGKCDRCGMTKPSQGTTISNSSMPYKTIHENAVMINPKKYNSQNFEYKEEDYWIKQINSLQLYQPTFEGLMEESDEYGEYVKLSDVLNLFSAKND
jgi:hypothetical protein